MILQVQGVAVLAFMAASCQLCQRSAARAAADSRPHSEDEIHPELRFVGAGILAMANSGPNSNGAPSMGAFCSRQVDELMFRMTTSQGHSFSLPSHQLLS